MFQAWPDIANFHNLRKWTKQFPEVILNKLPFLSIPYRAKVKLDGTNAAVHVKCNGEVLAQSRERMITPGKNTDNFGFATWVKENEESFKKLLPVDNKFITKDGLVLDDIVIFGERCGNAIQNRCSISKIDKKIFAIFNILYIFKDTSGTKSYSYHYDPLEIRLILRNCGDIPDTYIIPWYKDFSVNIDFSKQAEELQLELDKINQEVLEVEACDPWVKETFGIEGLGEGLVLYPMVNDYDLFNSLLFKAKGEKHNTVNQKKPAQVNADVAKSVDEFVNMVLTEARLEQGVSVLKLNDFNQKGTGPFLQWVVKDVQKETSAELEAANLTFDQVKKAISDKARSWYLEQGKKL